jgi:hypothetical protein
MAKGDSAAFNPASRAADGEQMVGSPERTPGLSKRA